MTRLPLFVWGLAVTSLVTVSSSAAARVAQDRANDDGGSVVVFTDGSEMEILSYEVKGGVVQFTTADGVLRSVPRTYVDLAATEARRGGGRVRPSSTPVPRNTRPPPTPAPTPEPDSGRRRESPLTTETIRPEPEPAPVPEPEPEVEAEPPDAIAGGSPPGEWANDELKVSLVVPSSEWRVPDMPPSFDVAVTLENPSTEARATLALVRRRLRGRNAFRELVQEIGDSVTLGTGHRALGEGELTLEPYETYEFRFVKRMGFVDYFNRIVVYYSRDLAYVLSLSCPEARVSENESDFEAIVRGLVIRKSRGDLSF